MSVLDPEWVTPVLVFWPSPILKQVSSPVTEPIDQEWLDWMWAVMLENRGIGLSAIQVGVAKRFFIGIHDLDVFEVYVNPVINEFVGKTVLLEEGCLSLPGQFEKVRRYLEIKVTYQTADLTQTVSKTLTGSEAHCFQHELDHLNGLLYVDKLSNARRSTVRANIQKLKKNGRHGW